jgi:hypothetical protein
MEAYTSYPGKAPHILKLILTRLYLGELKTSLHGTNGIAGLI